VPQYLEVHPDDLRKNPWNTNKVSPENERKIRASISRNGMFKPIIVRQIENVAGYEIIGGEHRWEQAIELDIEKIPALNLGFIDDQRAKEISLTDNARYGVDDTVELADLLKSMGDLAELTDFLPYGETDFDTLFASQDIALDGLEIDEDFEAEDNAPLEEPLIKQPKTHTIMRFKVPLGDAERITALIAYTQKNQDMTQADALTNAGDALVHLLEPYIG